MSPAPAFLVTSLAPGRDLGLQRAAVKSWQDAGFTVLSVNAAPEIPALTRDHPGVTLVTAAATAEKVAGKPVPYIHDLLKALRAACQASGTAPADCTVGVINDDIYLRSAPEDLAALHDAARGSLILGARVDVATAADLAAFVPSGDERYSIGYDYFLMSGDLLADFTDGPFCLGMPFWDYWLPLVALLRGRPLKALLSPVALHIDHQTRWDDTIYVFFHALIAAVMDVSRESLSTESSPQARQFALLFDVISHVYNDIFTRGTGTPAPGGIETLAAFYDRFQEVAVHHIKTQAKPFSLGARLP